MEWEVFGDPWRLVIQSDVSLADALRRNMGRIVRAIEYDHRYDQYERRATGPRHCYRTRRAVLLPPDPHPTLRWSHLELTLRRTAPFFTPWVRTGAEVQALSGGATLPTAPLVVIDRDPWWDGNLFAPPSPAPTGIASVSIRGVR